MRSEHTFPLVVSQPEAPSALGANGVLRNTYALLSATLFFSAAVTAASAALKLPHPGIVLNRLRPLG